MLFLLNDSISPDLAGTQCFILSGESYCEPISRIQRPADHIQSIVRIEGIKPTVPATLQSLAILIERSPSQVKTIKAWHSLRPFWQKI